MPAADACGNQDYDSSSYVCPYLRGTTWNPMTDTGLQLASFTIARTKDRGQFAESLIESAEHLAYLSFSGKLMPSLLSLSGLSC